MVWKIISNKTIFIIIILLIFFSSTKPIEAEISKSDVIVNPQIIVVDPKGSFSFDISCTPINPIKAYELEIVYDPSLIQINSISEGDIFKDYITFFNKGIIDNEKGIIYELYNVILGPGNVTSSGSLITVSGTALSNFGISDFLLISPI